MLHVRTLILTGLMPVLSVICAAPPANSADPVPDDQLESFFARQLDTVSPTADEKKIDTIGWTTDLGTAMALAKEHGRPVFLFTLDGWMGAGRC